MRFCFIATAKKLKLPNAQLLYRDASIYFPYTSRNGDAVPLLLSASLIGGKSRIKLQRNALLNYQHFLFLGQIIGFKKCVSRTKSYF